MPARLPAIISLEKRDASVSGSFRRADRSRGPLSQRSPLLSLLDGLLECSRRGDGAGAWASPHAHNALGFVLDAVSDAVVVRRHDGDVLFRNRAGASLDLPVADRPGVEELEVDGQTYVRRTMEYPTYQSVILVEVLSRKCE